MTRTLGIKKKRSRYNGGRWDTKGGFGQKRGQVESGQGCPLNFRAATETQWRQGSCVFFYATPASRQLQAIPHSLISISVQA
ncbi:hypothetical protein PISMIDRAFT_624262 [Pisolithus microcarpus 441]|uniref:Uncharacterized protein n=1 Tax=Pisolithus microcarpus 441 TaxID=765257 RepID=A0A0C9Y442_9AGAM|nr:hypothetical protein PISMIDRAFT_624262 [Pisolithus microcarpus 441]